MQRRRFLQHGCQLCLMGAACIALPSLSSCGATKYSVYKTGVTDKAVEVPVALFADSPLQIVRPNGWYRDIAVQKKEDGTYTALLLECTHQENALSVTGNGFHCSLHGSDFDRNGKVRKGPAEVALTHYSITVQSDIIIIHV